MKAVVLISRQNYSSVNSSPVVRMISYAMGLKREKIDFIFTSQLEEKYYQLNNKFEIHPVASLNNQTFNFVPSSSKTHTLLLKEFTWISAFRYLNAIYLEFVKNKNDSVVFLLYPNGIALFLVCLFYLKLYRRQRIFIEKNEMSFAARLNYEAPLILRDKLIFYLLQVVLLPIEFFKDILTPFFDGIVAISQKIMKQYQVLNKQILRVPILSYFQELNISAYLGNNVNSKKFNIGFFGALADRKDSIFNLIKAIGNNKTLKEKIYLQLFGSYNRSTKEKIDRLVNEYNLINSVQISKSIPNFTVINYMKQFDLLVLLRPKSLQNEFGFSTKLAEYCASKTPVLMTNVSDIPNYFIDRSNAFIIEKNKLDATSIEKKLIEIVNLPQKKLKEVGNRAFKTYLEFFHPYAYSKKLAQFFFKSS